MKRIGDFTGKYGAIESSSRSAVELVQRSIESVIEVMIPLQSIKISNGIAFIQTHPAIKQVIVSEKEKILSEIKKRGGKIGQIR